VVEDTPTQVLSAAEM